LLFHKPTSGKTEVFQLVIPENERQTVIASLHDSNGSHHLSYVKTLRRIQEYFYWSSMINDVRSFVTRCNECQRRTCHVNKLRKYVNRVSTVGVIIIKDHEIKELEGCPFVDTLRHEKETVEGVRNLDLSYLQFSHPEESHSLLSNHGFVLSNRRGTCNVTPREINLVEGCKPNALKPCHISKSHKFEIRHNHKPSYEICHDLMLTSVSCHDHMSISHDVFCDCKDNDVSLKLPKCKCVEPEVEFMSHVVEFDTRSSVLNMELSLNNTQTPHNKNFFQEVLCKFKSHCVYVFHFCKFVFSIYDEFGEESLLE